MPTPDQGDYPTGYMTPEQIAQMYQQSSALSKGGQRDDTITSPWQGARMMADALAGRSMRNQAGAAQQKNLNLDTTTRMMQPPPLSVPPSATPGTPPQMQAPPVTPTPPVRPPPMNAPMGASPPVPGLQGSVPPSMPGGPPGAPPGMVGGMQPQNPMMAALMSQPPGMGMS